MPTDELQVEEVVRRAIGFTVAPGSGKPWQILLTLTRKAIQREDELPRASDASAGDFSPMEELQHLGEFGMDPWVELYPIQENTAPRHVLDIARHTTDPTEATQWLNRFDSKHKTDTNNQANWVQARPGWNKKGKSIVILLKEWPQPYPVKRFNQLTFTPPRHNFGPILTVWLAEMAPRVRHRYLVIRHSIRYLMEFYNDPRKLKRGEFTGPPPEFEGDVARQEEMREWYAFHTLRRMFYLRFGCSMWQNGKKENRHDVLEEAGTLQGYDLTQDKAWLDYKREVKIRLEKYSRGQ